MVRPDTTAFRAELLAQLKTVVANPIQIPVIPVVGAGFAAATAGTAALAAAQGQAAVATAGSAAALASATTIAAQYTGVIDLAAVSTAALAATQEAEAAAATKATAAQAAHTRAVNQGVRGAGASALTLFGLRGATLAASGAFLAGTAAVVGFSKAVRSAAELETELNVFRVTAGATADEMLRVSEAAQQLGRDITLPGVTAGTAATAMTELAKAGLSVQDALGGARGVLQLSTAAQIEVADATQLVAGALNAFQLGGIEAVRVADLLTGAAKESQGEITDMGTALGQAAAVSKQFGVGIEDTVTLLTQLAQAGISGGRAGTSLRVAFLRLINPTAQAAKELEKLDVAIRDSQGRLRPQVFVDIQEALQGYTKANREAVAATIFGSDAIRTFAITGNAGAEAFLSTRDAITEQGLAAEAAAARTSGFQGDLENLSNQASSLGLTIGNLAKGPLAEFVKAMADTVSTVNEAITNLVSFGATIKDVGSDIIGAVPFLDSAADAIGAFASKTKVLLTPGLLPFKALNFAADQFKDEFDGTLAEIRTELEGIVSAGALEGGDFGLNQALVGLDAFVDKLSSGSPEAKKFADDVAVVRARLFELQNQGFRLFPDNIRSLFPPALLQGTIEDAKRVAEGSRNALEAGLPGAEIFDLTLEAFLGMGKGIEAAGVDAEAKLVAAIAKLITTSTRELAKLDEAFDVATAAGNRAGQLANLRQRLAEQQAIRDAADRAAVLAGAGNRGFDTAVKTRRAAQAQIAVINTQIRSIEAAITADAEQTAAAVQRSRDKVTQAFLDAQGVERDRQQNRILEAQATPGLQDDIKRQLQLAELVRDQIDAAKKRITNAAEELKVVTGLTAILKQVNLAVMTLVEQQATAQAERRSNLLAGIRLDIELAQINENQNNEIKRRLRLIDEFNKDLKAEEAAHGKTTLLYKQIRNQIAQERAAIEAIRAEKRKENQAFALASFEFLQAQQGFASNLLGNLIPRGATGGLVRGAQPVQQALQPVAGAAEARSTSGITAGQGNATNNILFQILQQLKELNGETKAPEARRQHAWSLSVMDGVGGS